MSRRFSGLLFLIISTAAVVFIYFNPPVNNKYYPPCIMKKLTGYDCAGCGSARACYQLLHGNILKAADHNILLVLLLPVITTGIIFFFTGRFATTWRKINRPAFFLLLIACFWILRNIPYAPFIWLHSDK